MKSNGYKKREDFLLDRLLGLICLFILGAQVVSCAHMGPQDEQFPSPLQKPADKPASKVESDPVAGAYANFTLASYLIASGRYYAAKGYLEKALQYEPNSLFMNKRMISLLSVLGDYENAIKFASRSIEIDPEDVEARILLAKIYSIAGREKEAATLRIPIY